MKIAFFAFSRFMLFAVLLGIAPPNGPNDVDLEFSADAQTVRENAEISLPVHVTNNSSKIWQFGCIGAPYFFDVEVSDQDGHLLAKPLRRAIEITRCIAKRKMEAGFGEGQSFEFELPLDWYGYKLNPGRYTVYATFVDPFARIMPITNASSTRLTVISD